MLTSLLYALAAAAAVLVVVASILTLASIRRLRLVAPQMETLPPQDVPEAARERLAPGLAQALELGFERPAAQRFVGQHAGGQPVVQYLLALTHRELPAAAFVMTLAMPERTRGWSIHFASRAQDGRTLITRNRSSIAGPMPLRGVRTVDVWLPDWPAVWLAHRGAMDEMAAAGAGPWRRLPADEWLRASADAETATFKARRHQGDLQDAGDGTWRIGWRWALPMLLRAWRRFGAASRPMAQDRAEAAGGSAAASLQAQVEHYEQESLRRRHGGWSAGAKWLLFFASAAVAALSFGIDMELPTLAALLAVLLFHEAGHYAAMRLAGYRDLKVFFLPFLGAAVTGRHEQPTAGQELAVLFAGPLPGLVLGLAALLLVPGPLLGSFGHACALLAVIINAFNLLPLHPLDGGKIFEILLLARWPRAAFAGRVLGVLGLGALALTIDGTLARSVVLGFVIVMAIGLKHQWHESRLAAALRDAGGSAGRTRTEALGVLFGEMSRLGLGALPWAQQRLFVDALLPVAMRPRLTRLARGGGLAFYAACLALPVLGAMAWVAQMQQRPREAPRVEAPASPGADWTVPRNAELQALRARLASAPPDTRWALIEPEMDRIAEDLQGAGAAALPAAAALLDDARQLAGEVNGTPARRAQAALWRATAERDDALRVAALREALVALDDPAVADRAPALFVEAAARWVQEAAPGAVPEPLAVAERALATADAAGSGEALPMHLRALRETALDAMIRSGRGAEALERARAWHEAQLRRRDPAGAAASGAGWVDAALASTAPAAALQVVDTVLTQLEALQPPPDGYELDALRRQGLWLAEAAGRADWQRAQVARLAPPDAMPAATSWGQRAAMWLLAGGPRRPPTLLDVERAHFAGDEPAAREAAQALLRSRPGFAVPLPPPGPAEHPIAAARQRLVAEGRRALCVRYGLPLRDPGTGS